MKCDLRSSLFHLFGVGRLMALQIAFGEGRNDPSDWIRVAQGQAPVLRGGFMGSSLVSGYVLAKACVLM